MRGVDDVEGAARQQFRRRPLEPVPGKVQRANGDVAPARSGAGISRSFQELENKVRSMTGSRPGSPLEVSNAFAN
jgi:hypothetical protein